jgi:SagB-type dehydrogenase family enzyme
MAWKYTAIAYALTLKHVGVVFQTVYLTATDMNLAPCALGGGDSDLFARVASTDYYTETSVGEFLLGSSRDEIASSSAKSTHPGSLSNRT